MSSLSPEFSRAIDAYEEATGNCGMPFKDTGVTISLLIREMVLTMRDRNAEGTFHRWVEEALNDEYWGEHGKLSKRQPYVDRYP